MWKATEGRKSSKPRRKVTLHVNEELDSRDPRGTHRRGNSDVGEAERTPGDDGANQED